jgi:hypothetical protein
METRPNHAPQRTLPSRCCSSHRASWPPSLKIFIVLLVVLGVTDTRGQLSFSYDQQSATNAVSHYGYLIQAMYPMGQSFTPSLPAIDFVQLQLSDAWQPHDGLGATMFVNLRSGSITGAVLASSSPVVMPDGFVDGITNFMFPSTVSLTAGSTYYIEPILQATTEPWYIKADYYYYPGGSAFLRGNPIDLDLWLREGVAIPEPIGTASA